MALHGNLDAFISTDGDDWTVYLARLDQYYKANKIEDGRKKAVFLTVIGDTTFRLLQSLIAPAKVDDETLSELSQVLSGHFSPKRLVIPERFCFWNRTQNRGENYQDFVAELRRLSRNCDFGDTLEETIRDRFVCGILDSAVQKKLLTIDALSLEVALKTAVAQETVDKEAASLVGGTSSVRFVKPPKKANDRTVKGASGQAENRPGECYRCGGKNHLAKDCRFKNADCNHCGRKGHIARVCRSWNFAASTKLILHGQSLLFELSYHNVKLIQLKNTTITDFQGKINREIMRSCRFPFPRKLTTHKTFIYSTWRLRT